MQATSELARKELVKAHEEQNSFDKIARHRLFELRDKCLVLLSIEHNGLLAQRKGPYEVVQIISDVQAGKS